MAKKSKKEEVAAAADAVEASAPENQEISASVEELIDFEAWYALREAAIPAHHHREIIKADFSARKVPAMATLAQFDDALRKYGIELA